MTFWEIKPCTLADDLDLARNNVSAFWMDSNWRPQWPKHITRDFLIGQCAKKKPNDLLDHREALRHQKAVDPETGALVGYACWELPPSHAGPNGRDTAPEWADAQIPDVSAEERNAFERRADGAWWEPIPMEDVDYEADLITDRILSTKPYISLRYLAVHPKNQGKGVPTALVESGIRQAEKMGLDVFIQASQAGLNLYKRLGFKEVDRVVQDNAKWGGTGEYAVYLLTLEVKQSPQSTGSVPSSRPLEIVKGATGLLFFAPTLEKIDVA